MHDGQLCLLSLAHQLFVGAHIAFVSSACRLRFRLTQISQTVTLKSVGVAQSPGISEVPQGDVVVHYFVNDFPDFVRNSVVKIFADIVKIYVI